MINGLNRKTKHSSRGNIISLKYRFEQNVFYRARKTSWKHTRVCSTAQYIFVMILYNVNFVMILHDVDEFHKA